VIKFIRDWQAYRAGQTVDPKKAALNKGVIDLLLQRGIIICLSQSVGYDTMDKAVKVTMAKGRGRPKGSKNKAVR